MQYLTIRLLLLLKHSTIYIFFNDTDFYDCTLYWLFMECYLNVLFFK